MAAVSNFGLWICAWYIIPLFGSILHSRGVLWFECGGEGTDFAKTSSTLYLLLEGFCVDASRRHIFEARLPSPRGSLSSR
jgi:hypothetical protein